MGEPSWAGLAGLVGAGALLVILCGGPGGGSSTAAPKLAIALLLFGVLTVWGLVRMVIASVGGGR